MKPRMALLVVLSHFTDSYMAARDVLFFEAKRKAPASSFTELETALNILEAEKYVLSVRNKIDDTLYYKLTTAGRGLILEAQ